MTVMTLTLLTHGSPDPRHSRAVSSLVGRLEGAGIRARAAFLDHDSPSPDQAARALADAGGTSTTVVPLLVSPAYHARVDVPAAVRAMRAAAPELAVAAAEPVGLHPLLMDAAAELAEASGFEFGPTSGLILAAAGSRDLRAIAAIDGLVRARGDGLARSLGARAVRTAYLDGGRPLGRIRTLMRCVDGCTTFLVVPIVMAEGILRDRIATTAARHEMAVAPGSLADTEAMVDLIVLRAGRAPAPARAPVGAAR